MPNQQTFLPSLPLCEVPSWDGKRSEAEASRGGHRSVLRIPCSSAGAEGGGCSREEGWNRQPREHSSLPELWDEL